MLSIVSCLAASHEAPVPAQTDLLQQQLLIPAVLSLWQTHQVPAVNLYILEVSEVKAGFKRFISLFNRSTGLLAIRTLVRWRLLYCEILSSPSGMIGMDRNGNDFLTCELREVALRSMVAKRRLTNVSVFFDLYMGQGESSPHLSSSANCSGIRFLPSKSIWLKTSLFLCCVCLCFASGLHVCAQKGSKVLEQRLTAKY